MTLISGTTPDYPRGDVIHEVFRRVAAADPDATALVHRDVCLTYDTLDRLSNGLAAELAERGVGPGHIVPVLAPRSPEWVTALLAVLKCGAGYLAVDPRWPDERIRRLTRLVDPPLTVAAEPQAGRAGGSVHRLPELAGIAASAYRPPVSVGGDDISTVFLTSGSSGEPKLVLSPHRATVRMFVDCDFARFDPSTVMPQGSPVPWDAASLELWGPLLTGGVCALLDESHLQPVILRDLVATAGLNTVFLTTSLFNVLVEEDVRAFHGLRAVLTGGEKLSVHHIRRFRQVHPDIDLISAYGPVENTIFATTHLITDADAAGDAIPLGRPVHHTAVAVFDGQRACPPGDVGEICIAGAGLARGYLGAPELTAEKFVDLTPGDRTLRMYRTGDFGYLSEDGVLHFVGRRDRQVKVRGHRIEPQEIEDQMLAVPGITRGVVVPVRDRTGACQKLAAFYTAAPNGPGPADVVAGLRGLLPAYLVPEVVRKVARIPFSATGKADHEQLLTMLADPAEPAGPTDVDLPRDELERTVAAEFAAVLGTSAAGRDASFFDSGGTSLDALRLCTRLAERLGHPVPQSILPAAPTVAGLADRLRGTASAPASPLAGSGERSRLAPVGLLPMQRAFWLNSMLEPASVASQCVSVWRDVDVAPDVLARAVDDVYRRHPGLRATIALEDEPRAVVPANPAPIAVPTLASSADPQATLLRHLYEPFDLERGPVFRAALAEAADGEGWLFGLSVHHAFYDEWAEQLLVDDLLTAVAAREAGAVPRFARPAPSLAEVHESYLAQRAGVDLDSQRSYWQRKLRDAPRLPALAPDTPTRGAYTTEPVSVRFPPEAVARLGRVARRRGAATSQVVIATLAEAISSVVEVTDLVLGVAVAKRGHPTLANAVTCLLDAVCLRLSRLGNGLDETLADCQTELVGALSNQDVSVTELAGLIGTGHARGRPPYDVLCVLQHQPHPGLRSGVAVPLFQPTSRELIAEARPQPDGGLVLALLHVDQAEVRSVAERIAAEVSRLAMLDGISG